MPKRTPDDILSDVAWHAIARADWAFLSGKYFHGSVSVFNQWAKSNHLSWRLEASNRGPSKGQTIIFYRGPGWKPPPELLSLEDQSLSE